MSRRSALLVLALVGALLAAACGSPASGPPATTVRVLAGSELADMVPVLDRAAAATGVRVQLSYTGSLAGVDAVASGRASTDAVWFASTRYLDLDPRTRPLLGTATPIMTSPVVLGLRRSVAERLGWVGRPVSWKDITAAAGAKAFTFGMTDPHVSNSGFSALVGITAAASGSGQAPDEAATRAAAPALRSFFAAQTLTSGSTGYLVDAFADRATGRVPGPPVDGIIGYEASLQSLDRSGRLPEPLVPIYPTDGVVSADYPVAALTSAGPAVADAVTRLAAWLRSPEGQRDIATTTLRRPGNPAAGRGPAADQPPVVELPFPGSRAVVDSLLAAYDDEYRRPARTVYVLDTSGSMAGARLAALQQALVGLTGNDPTGTTVRAREDVTLLPFSTTPGPAQRFVVDPVAPDVARSGIRTAAAGLRANGDTALYDSLDAAFADLAAAPPDDRITTVVLMTDGESNTGSPAARGLADLDARPASTRAVPVFPILFGESAVPEMTAIAAHTGGTVFDARTVPLPDIFREIRSYQ